VIRLKVITEADLRVQLRASEPAVYYIEEGKLLSPAAREYLQQRKIKIAKASEAEQENTAQSMPKILEVKSEAQAETKESKAPVSHFIDYETEAYYVEKPEHMTHLHGNVLVVKNHPRILFRGKLDSLQSLIVLDQAILAEKEGNQKIINDLSEILKILREIMRCDVVEEEFKNGSILGLNHDELREHSHDPMKFYNIKQMTLPDYTMGKTYALLNQIRSSIRETEVAATEAFYVGKKYTRKDIIEELNRLSSSLHIMMCMYLAGQYS
jgi:ethanolamine utilization cobalamin adenosyltransferase